MLDDLVELALDVAADLGAEGVEGAVERRREKKQKKTVSPAPKRTEKDPWTAEQEKLPWEG